MDPVKTILLLQTGLCALCGATVIPEKGSPGLCVRCAEELEEAPGPFLLEDTPGITAACLYGGTIKRAIEMLKISGRTEIAAPLSRLLLLPLYEKTMDDWSREGPMGDALQIVPVPGSVDGTRRRGFDPAVLLARQLSCRLLPIVVRRRGRMQKTLNREERLSNAREQYHPSRKRAGSIPARVLIVDDVVTTGASILRCGEILEELGVREWRAITLAARI